MVHPFRFQIGHRALRAACLVSLSLWALTANSQTAPVAPKPAPHPAATPAAKPDPLDPLARVPALRYESSLKTSKATGEEKPVSWREANDTVTRIGGWRVYLREAQLPEPPTSTPPTLTPSTPAPVLPPAAAASSATKSTTPTATPSPHGPHHGHPQR